MTIYLDNAATSHPKPACVYEAVRRALSDIGASPGRAAHRRAREADAVLSDARLKAAQLLGIDDPRTVSFTRNATESINIVLKGWLRPGDRVLISAVEHNSVVRPLSGLKSIGIQTTVVPCSERGTLRLDAFESLLDPPPRLVVLTHASNVNGGLQPVVEAARLCRAGDVPLLLDAAQTAGLQTIRAKNWDLGMLACSGHKALLGPPGVGILYVRKDLDVRPLMEGGTGSRSEEDLQPDYSPDRYESGTPNLPGIAGLAAGMAFIVEEGMDALLRHELELSRRIEEGLSLNSRVRVLRPDVRGTGTVSFTVDGLNPSDIGHILDEAFDIAVRTGLHCAPLAHRTLGTFPEGTVRVSPGFSTSSTDIDYFLDSMRLLLSRQR